MMIGRIEFAPDCCDGADTRHLDEACEVIADLVRAVRSYKDKYIWPQVDRAEAFLTEMGRGEE